MMLYGMFVMFTGAVEILTSEGDPNFFLYLITLGGVLALFAANRLTSGNSESAFFAVVIVTAMAILLTWMVLTGWLAFFGGTAHVFFSSIVLTVALFFSLLLIPVQLKAWRRTKRFESLM